MAERSDKRRIKTARRRREALELRSKGHSYQDIADILGYANARAVSNDITAALKEVVQDPADLVRQMELDRLDLLFLKTMEIMMKDHYTVSNGRVVKLDNVPLNDDAPVLNAIATALKIQERRANYLGLDFKHRINDDGTAQANSLLGALLADIRERNGVTPPTADNIDEGA